LKRKNYSKELKTKVALAGIKGNQTANEIASEFGIHVSLVNRWKKEAIEALPLVFGDTQAKQSKKNEVERERLYQKVGKLQIELDWLKKNTGHLVDWHGLIPKKCHDIVPGKNEVEPGSSQLPGSV
jgi:transposase